jgi:hypothetical protein
MPYKIKKLPLKSEWKVYSESSGKPLSNKGLTLTNAKKQLIAVTLSEVSQAKQIPQIKKKEKRSQDKNRIIKK